MSTVDGSTVNGSNEILMVTIGTATVPFTVKLTSAEYANLLVGVGQGSSGCFIHRPADGDCLAIPYRAMTFVRALSEERADALKINAVIAAGRARAAGLELPS